MDRRAAIKHTVALSGASLSASILAGILTSGCRAGNGISWSPSFLSDKEAVLVSKLSDLMLPPTESPGALEVHVPEFVDLMANDCLTEEEQRVFRKGLESVESQLNESIGGSFLRANSEQQSNALHEVDRKAFDDQALLPAYRLLKQLILLGYFTSEQVMTNELNYHAIAGRYDACVLYDDGDRAFVDNNVEGRL